MKTSLKKLVAGASIVALVAMNALSVDADTAVTATAALSADEVVITAGAATFAGSCTVSIKRTNQDGTTTAIANTCSVTDSTNLTVTAPGLLATGEYYTISFTSNGYFGAVATGDTTNEVTVSAVVLPVLSMDLSTSSIDFGELNPTTPTTRTLDVKTASNARQGIVVSMASEGLRTGDTANDKYIGNYVKAGSLATTTTGTDTYQVSSSTTAGGAALTLADVASTQNVLNATNVAMSNATTTVSLTADIADQTEAGNYGDTLTFTVTGNF